MDFEELRKIAVSYGQAVGRTLFAIESEDNALAGRLQKKSSELMKSYEKECAIIKNRVANSLFIQGSQLKSNLISFEEKDESVISTCEHLKLGSISLPGMVSLESSLRDIPFIVPMIGHGHLALIHNSDDTRCVLTKTVWDVISKTAPGQLQIITYNPHLRNQLSFLSNVELFSTIISTDELQNLFESISQEVLQVDSMLKGSYDSIIDLRKASKQPVGALKLIVLQDTEFLFDDKLREKFFQIIKNCARAGICFIISDTINDQKRKLIENISTISFCRVLSKSKLSSVAFSCDIEIDKAAINYEAEVAEYIKKSSETRAITIPFSEIEDTKNYWKDSTKDGITFSMGRSGLDIVTLRLGDSATQLHNALITGAAGKGKSNLIEVIIHSICTRYSPNEIELYLLDFKDGLTFKPYSDANDGSYLPHAKVLGLESERDIGLATLKYIEHIRENRAKVFKEAGDCKGISSYRSLNPDSPMPRILLIIDEYQRLFEKADDVGLAAAELLENIVRQGRAFGIHVILASQTITGAAALIGRTDNIYAQFPIRIALQNNINESFATFVPGNDAAAKLRIRGEAVLNKNYGALDSNQRFTVAYAEPEEMKKLRKTWFHQIQSEYKAPVVFRKNEEFHLPSLFDTIKSWRHAVEKEQAAYKIPCGVAISVQREHINVRMSNDSGRNVAIIGSGDDAQNTGLLTNDAIGIIQAMGIALALQHVDGKARFSLINGVDKTLFDKNGMSDWLSLMEQMGYFVDVIGKDDAPAFFQKLAKEVTDPSYNSEEAHYVFCLALDRCSSLSLSLPGDDSNNTGVFFAPTPEKGTESFQKVLQFGSARGVHIISWWTNATIYKDHIGYQGDGFINTKILLRVDNNTAQNILGMLTAWSVQNNRALIHDNTDLEANYTVAPFKPVSKRDCGMVLSEDWNK